MRIEARRSMVDQVVNGRPSKPNAVLDLFDPQDAWFGSRGCLHVVFL
jgi:hypothetical protein